MRPAPPVATRGLTHIALSVRDPKRWYAFYRAVLGVEKVYEDDGFLQAQPRGAATSSSSRRRHGVPAAAAASSTSVSGW